MTAGKHKTPKPDVFQQVIKPLAASLNAVVSFTEENFWSKYRNHLLMVRQGIGSLGWVAVTPNPAAYVKEKFDQALFYGLQVHNNYKRKDGMHLKCTLEPSAN